MRTLRTRPRVRALLAVLAAALAASACDDPSGSGAPPATIAVFSGSGQQGPAGTTLTSAVAVRVSDAGGEAVRGAQVTWSARNGGTVAPASSPTDPRGVAYATWRLGPGFGEQRLVARVEGVADSAVFTARATTGSASGIRIKPDSLVFTTLRRPQPVWAVGLDAFGNESDPVVAQITSLDPQIVVVDGQSGTAMATAVGIGRARIVATSPAGTDTVAAVVRPVLAALGSDELGLFPAVPATLGVGETLHLYAVDSSRVVIPATFTSSAPAVAEVDANGVLRVRGAGSTTISATREGSTVTATLTAAALAAPARSLTAGGYHTCGLAPGGVAYCWGSGFGGPYPRPTAEGEPRPTRIRTGVRFDMLEAGRQTTCGISLQGRGYCWGVSPYRHMNVPPTTAEEMEPIQSPPSLRTLSTAANLLCAVTEASAGYEAGDVYCWNYRDLGRWGRGYRQVSIGTGTSPFNDYLCGLRQDGTVACSSAAPGTPVTVATVGTVAFDTLSAGHYFGCGLSAGTAYCWGENNAGQLGRGTSGGSSAVAQPVAGGHTFTSLSVGWEHACAVDADGQAWCWGANYTGQLGSGTTTGSSTPVRVSQGATRFAGITAAGNLDDFFRMVGHTCAVATDGEIYCWGDNRYGQLGIGTVGGTRATPTQVVRPRS